MDRVVCSQQACLESFANHRWGSVRANSAGWFIPLPSNTQRKVWCPKHLPTWVEAWRNRKMKET